MIPSGPVVMLWLVGTAVAFVLAAAVVGCAAMLVGRLALLVLRRIGEDTSIGLPHAIARFHQGDPS